MEFLERDAFMTTLNGYAEEAASGDGRFVLVAGEAGIGKTTLIERFQQSHAGATWLWGACDGLFTPRPLGPLFDVAWQLGGEIGSIMLRRAPREEVFATFLTRLDADEAVTVVVFEDVHWADEATLDLLRFIARRISSTRCLFLVTYRNDGIDEHHPLRVTIGDLVTLRATRRITLPPLTQDAVRTLAAAKDLDPEELHRATGGNPLFLEEVLAAGSPREVPATVRDAVLARAARLPAGALAALEAASVIGTRVEQSVLRGVLGSASADIDGCIGSGLITTDAGTFRFRHELSRRAIEDSIPPDRGAQLHGRVLRTLRLLNADPARMAHHAEAAGEVDAVLEFAPTAAKEAAELGSHRQAVAQYVRALRYRDRLPPEKQAVLLEGLSYSSYLINQLDDAYTARRSALECWELVGDGVRQGDNLRWCSRLLWFLARNHEAEEAAQQAIAILEPLPPGPELAMAYSNLSQLRMLAQDCDEAVRWGSRALDLAQKIDEPAVVAHALNNIGSAELLAGSEAGKEKLKESLHLAIENNLQEHVDRALTNLADHSLWQRNYHDADAFLSEGIAYCDEQDLESCRFLLRSSQAVSALQQGRWDEAESIAAGLVADTRPAVMGRIQALVVLGLVHLRRGQPDHQAVLDEALRLAQPIGELAKLWPVRAARAEAAWWAGDTATAGDEAAAVFDLACRQKDRWATGELALWMWWAGRLAGSPEGAAAPFALHIQGDFAGAAEAWNAIGCPYEAALALSDSAEETHLRRALEMFQSLGAAPAAAQLKKKMRKLGIRSIPSGPRTSTRANPVNLTAREAEVAALLARGLRNAEISERLFIAEKTVDHHVSSVLAKMGLKSRAAVAREAERLGILEKK